MSRPTPDSDRRRRRPPPHAGRAGAGRQPRLAGGDALVHRPGRGARVAGGVARAAAAGAGTAAGLRRAVHPGLQRRAVVVARSATAAATPTRRSPTRSSRGVQIALDWLVMTVLTALTGGVESPAIIFFLFHISIAALLLPHERVFLYVALAPVLVTLVAVLEYVGRAAARGAVRRAAARPAALRLDDDRLLHGRLLHARLHLRGHRQAAPPAREGNRRAVRERARDDVDARPGDRAEPPRRIDDARPRLQGGGDPADRPQAQAGGVRGHLRVERRVRGEGAAGLHPRPPRPGDAGGRAAVRERRRRRPAHLEPEAGARGRDRVDALGAAGGQGRPARRAARLRRRRAPLQRRGRGLPRTRRRARRRWRSRTRRRTGCSRSSTGRSRGSSGLPRTNCVRPSA